MICKYQYLVRKESSFGKLSYIFSKFRIVVCKLFHFGMLCYVMEKFKFVIWERIKSLPHNKIRVWSKLIPFDDTECYWKHKIWILISRKHCGKRRKCRLQACSSFHSVLSSLLPSLIKTQESCCQELTPSQMTNFRLFHTGRVCRWQFKIWWKWQKVIQTGRKH